MGGFFGDGWWRTDCFEFGGNWHHTFLGGLFRGVNSDFGGLHHNIFGWIYLDGDGQTVLNFAGTGTTKFSGGLFRGENSYFGGLHHNILGGLIWMVMDRLF